MEEEVKVRIEAVHFTTRCKDYGPVDFTKAFVVDGELHGVPTTFIHAKGIRRKDNANIVIIGGYPGEFNPKRVPRNIPMPIEVCNVLNGKLNQVKP